MARNPCRCSLQGITMANRLTANFAASVLPHLDAGDQDSLSATIEDWQTRLACIKSKSGTYNEYDEIDALHLFERAPLRGTGWTAHLLEHCRKEGQIAYVKTGNEQTDLFVICREL